MNADPRDRQIAVLQSRLDEAARELLDLRAEVALRRKRDNAAMDCLRSRFTLRPDCWIDEAAQDAVNAHNLVVGRLHAAEAAEVQVRAAWDDAVVAHDVDRGTLASVSAQLDRARARLDSVRLAALVMESAAKRMVENTGADKEVPLG